MLGDAPSLFTLSWCPSESDSGGVWGGGFKLKVDDGGVEGAGRWGRRTGCLSWFTIVLLFSGFKLNRPSRKKREFFLIFHPNVSSAVCKTGEIISTFLNKHKHNQPDLKLLKSAADTCIPTAANISAPAGWVATPTKAARNRPAGAAACFQTPHSARRRDPEGRSVCFLCSVQPPRGSKHI